MPEHDGWFGEKAQLDYVLATFGCDRDSERRFLVGGTIAVGLGGQEVVVGSDAFLLVNGKPVSLVGALWQTSYGAKVKVF